MKKNVDQALCEKIFSQYLHHQSKTDMINTNDLLRTVRAAGAEFTHKKLSDLLSGIRGSVTKRDIQIVRKCIKEEVTTIDKVLSKLENQQ